MTYKAKKTDNSYFKSFFECQYQLSDWIHGTNLLSEMKNSVSQNLHTLNQLLLWKESGLIFPKPTLSLKYTFVFWAHKSIIESVLSLSNIQGGFPVQKLGNSLPDSSSYKGKKLTPRPRRVLLDVGCESSTLLKRLKQLGLEVVRLWDYAADLLHYEIIELCTAQYIDLLVTTNEKLLLPREEWLDYLMPHRSRMLIIPHKKLKFPSELAQSIYNFAHIKRKFKVKNQPFNITDSENKSKLRIGG